MIQLTVLEPENIGSTIMIMSVILQEDLKINIYQNIF